MPAVISPLEVIERAYATVVDLVRVGCPLTGDELRSELGSLDPAWRDSQTAASLGRELLVYASERNAQYRRQRDEDNRNGGVTDDELKAKAFYAGLAFISVGALSEHLRLA